jgi:protein-disulfide isomerase
MPPVDRTASTRFNRRGVIAGSALGVSALGVAAMAVIRSRHPGVGHVGDPALAGPLGDVWVGSPQAKVTLVEYAALTCPHCAAFHDGTWPAVRARWVDAGQVRFALRGYPLSPLDTAGFMLAGADGDRHYYAVTDLLFARQRSWAFVEKPLDALREVVQQAGIGRDRFDAILRDQSLYDGVQRVFAQATSALGVHSTPTLFVDDDRHEGAPTADTLGEIIARALVRSPG